MTLRLICNVCNVFAAAREASPRSISVGCDAIQSRRRTNVASIAPQSSTGGLIGASKTVEVEVEVGRAGEVAEEEEEVTTAELSSVSSDLDVAMAEEAALLLAVFSLFDISRASADAAAK